MQPATSFNTVVTGLLTRLAASRRTAFSQGARRFTALVAARGELEEGRPEGPALVTPATLKISSGLHGGASVELTEPEYLIGCGDDCDIVLRDSHVAGRHCSLSRGWSGFSVQDLRGKTPRPVPPGEIQYEGGAIEVQYQVGELRFVVRQAAPPRDSDEPGVAPERSAPRTVLLVGLVGVLLGVMAIATTGRVAKADSAAEARRLSELNARNQGARTQVLLEQARQALGDGSLRVEVQDGRLLVEGRTTRAALKTRIQALADDLRGTIPVEDRVTYTEAADNAGAPGPLPVRVQSVMVADPSYFITDNGARYFVGGVLPDGAEVVSIDANEIRFARAGRVAVYKLQQ
jgi:hypothetical protein